jgi:hypothetical protein
MSVNEMTPVNRPVHDVAVEAANVEVRPGEAGEELCGATKAAGITEGVAGAECDGDAASTTHILCDLVAKILAVV